MNRDVLFRTFLYHVKRRKAAMTGHRITSQDDGALYWSQCSCGWVSLTHEHPAYARGAARAHLTVMGEDT